MRSDVPTVRYLSRERLRGRLAGLGGAESFVRTLDPAERAEGDAWRDADRREEWLLGRLLARFAIAWKHPGLDVTILSRNEQSRGDRPRVLVDGNDPGWSLSISHTDRGLLVAFADDGRTEVGADLVLPERFAPSFLETWFTTDERRDLVGAGDSEAALVWAVKEAVYKACQQGEGFAPRRIEVVRLPGRKFACRWFGTPLDEAAEIVPWTVDGQVAVHVVVDRPGWETIRPASFAASEDELIPDTPLAGARAH
jgi:phosphopantetheinyl transferase